MLRYRPHGFIRDKEVFAGELLERRAQLPRDKGVLFSVAAYGPWLTDTKNGREACADHETEFLCDDCVSFAKRAALRMANDDVPTSECLKVIDTDGPGGRFVLCHADILCAEDDAGSLDDW